MPLSELDKLFDQVIFTEALHKTKSPLALFKDTLQNGTNMLDDAFSRGGDIVALVHKRAWLIDQLLIRAWRLIITSENLALIAVGGYGRGELHPASDIDLMILKQSKRDKITDGQIRHFLTFLWDLGLEVGHSVRTVKECITQARADVTVATNIMEARLLIGEQSLFDRMCALTGPDKIWPTKKFFKAKWQEQIERHAKYANTEYNLEPNVKEGPGSLRDIQVIGWIAKRHFKAKNLHALVAHHFLTEAEFHTLSTGQNFLWCIRYALHHLTGRGENRLRFDYQRQIARHFGYTTEGNRGVEQFMKQYYQTIRELSRLNEMLLQHFQEAIIYASNKDKIKPINTRFQIRNHFIEARRTDVFKRYPFALLEIFLLKQQTLSIKGVRASTIRLLRQHAELIDDNFRNDIRNKSLFMEIIRQPRYVGHELRRMHRYGILGKYLPAFGRIEGQMQFDLFHAYTVDEHILGVVRNMRLFGLPEYAEAHPLCQHVLNNLPKQELLYLAGLFHDIAKGRGGDHSELGKEDAIEFCLSHGLSNYDAKLVGWLVEHHLIFSKTAQREDIDDPEIINQFALKVSDEERLDYLYLLTVADVKGTNPELWNSWKASLFNQLYKETARALRRGLENPVDKKERAEQNQEAAITLINEREKSKLDITQFWAFLGEDYFIRYSADEIVWHTKAIAGNSKYPLVTVRQQTNRGGTEVFVYMQNQDGIFAVTTRILDQLGLTIVDARVVTSTHGFTLDTYIVLDQSGKAVKEKRHRQDIIDKVHAALVSLSEHRQQTSDSRLQSRRQKNFPIPTRVRFTQDEKNNRTIMEVTATDRPGFLSRIGTVLMDYSVRLHSAKIATYGTRVEDIFFITDKQEQAITEPTKLAELNDSIIKNFPEPA